MIKRLFVLYQECYSCTPDCTCRSLIIVLPPAPAVAAIVRSYVSEATTEKERTGAMAGVSSAQALGFILGPGKNNQEEIFLDAVANNNSEEMHSRTLGILVVLF